MYNDRDPMNPMNTRGGNMSITPGTTVYDVNGDKVGSVQQYNTRADCIVVEKGLLFKKDLYIPTADIQSTDADGIHLDLSKDDLTADRFTAIPASGASQRDLNTDRDTDLNP